MVLVTTLVGFYLGSAGALDAPLLVHALLGTGLGRGGHAGAESVHGARSRRARWTARAPPAARRPPACRSRRSASGSCSSASGSRYLAAAVNVASPPVTAAIAVSYLLLYTPLKPVTPLCSLVGAVPGALPPVAGWAAARGSVGIEALVLFAIMFLWQIPHSLAIGALYRDDYARAGIRVLPVVDRDGPSTATYAVGNCLALLPVALLPTLLRHRRAGLLRGGARPRARLPLGGRRPRAHAARRTPPAGSCSPRSSTCRCCSASLALDRVPLPMSADASAMPRRPRTPPAPEPPPVSNTRLAMVAVIVGRDSCCSPG